MLAAAWVQAIAAAVAAAAIVYAVIVWAWNRRPRGIAQWIKDRYFPPRVSLESGIRTARKVARSGRAPNTPTKGAPVAEQPLDDLLAKTAETVWAAAAYGSAEWQAVWASDPLGAGRRLLLVRVDDCGRPGLLAGVTGFDLFGLGKTEARDRLVASLSATVAGRAKPAVAPGFPGGEPEVLGEPRFPRARQDTEAGRDVAAIQKYGPVGGRPRELGVSSQRIWGNVPAKNPGFTGRGKLLARVRRLLLDGDRAVVQALHGAGGVGKTQLACEYAHRYAYEHDIVWWIPAERSEMVGEQFAALARELGQR